MNNSTTIEHNPTDPKFDHGRLEPSSDHDKDVVFTNYRDYCRPGTADLMRVVGLDKVYHRADGDYMFYRDDAGTEQAVLDFLGGYGASLFGHNNPHLVDAAVRFFQESRPFNAQASCRGAAAKLAAKLNSMLRGRFGGDWVTTFASTGTEAVEAALKHALLEKQVHIDQLIGQIEEQLTLLRRRLTTGQCRIGAATFREMDPGFAASIGLKSDSLASEDIVAFLSGEITKLRSIRPTFASLKNSFHGKTLGSVQLTYNQDYRQGVNQQGPENVFVDPGCPAELIALVENCRVDIWYPASSAGELLLTKSQVSTLAGLFIEPIQGEGGIHEVPQEFLQVSLELARSDGFPIIADEIQCGMGRTGTFLHSEQLALEPDYILLGKSLGGGLAKISALVVKKTRYQDLFSRIHTSTFAEDDFSASIAFEALKLLDNSDLLYANCRNHGSLILDGLRSIQRKYPGVIDAVRGTGLMIGIQFAAAKDSSAMVLRILSESGLLGYVIAGYLLNERNIRVAPTLSSHGTIRVEPSAFISRNDIQIFLRAFERLCEIIFKCNSYELIKYIIDKPKTSLEEEIFSYRKEASAVLTARRADRRVAFIGHFILPDHLSLWDSSFEQMSVPDREVFVRRVYRYLGPNPYDSQLIQSETGEWIEFHFIGLCLTSAIIFEHMQTRDLAPVTSLIDEAVRIAIDKGCSHIGFGGYSSIVTANCTSIVTDKIGLTSGNSFTVAMGLDAMEKAASEKGIILEDATVAVLGATGNIGSIYSKIVAERANKLVLVGRNEKLQLLERLAGDIYFEALQAHDSGCVTAMSHKLYNTAAFRDYPVESLKLGASARREFFAAVQSELGDASPITVTGDLNGLKEADCIVAASNSPQPLIKPEHLKNGPVIIADIATPSDTDPSVEEVRSDVMVIQGGLVAIPNSPNLTVPGVPLENGTLYACMSETLLLGLETNKGSFSCGRISKDQVKEISAVAKIHGFRLAAFKMGRSY